ncbi:EAL domain-containing protein [Methylophaga sp.]|uniref:EAL domain-containing protein n=1 Tax=Methylophaga sp. TaxID=2024840 RepID=UPI003F69B839
MRIREKLSLIVIISILVTAIPAAVWITSYAKDKILNREIKNLLTITQNQAKSASDRLRAGEPKLQGLARILQEDLQKPIKEQELEAFHREMALNDDGVWRNQRDDFDGKKESGIFLPDSPALTDRQKVINLRIKRVMDSFGAAANRLHENIWYLSHYRSEVIFNRTFPNFVYDQAATNDYTQTPWMTYTSPEQNPERDYTFTPPLFDPVTEVWMISALYPLYLGDKWVGALGEDMPLTNVLGFIFSEQQLYPDTQHFLLDKEGGFILAGKWQQRLESTKSQPNFELGDEDDLEMLLNSAILTHSPNLLSEKISISGQQYLALGMLIAPVDWAYFRLVPIKNIVEPAQQLLVMLFIMVFVITAVCGGLITTAINRNVVSRITRLTKAISRYQSGDKKAVAEDVQGHDEITLAAREFDVMAERVAHARHALAMSEERWKFALEGARDGVWDWDIATNEVLYSLQWKKMLGYEDHEISDQFSEWELLLHPDDKVKAAELLRGYLANKYETFSAEFRLACKDGSWKWVLSRGIVVKRDKNMQPLRMIGTHTDISYLKAIQSELQRHTVQLQQLLEYSPVAIRIASEGGRKVIFANRRYTELLNLDAADVLGVDPADYYVNKDQHLKYLEKINSGDTVSDELTQLDIPGAGNKWVLASYLPIQYEHEECVIGWFYDVSDRLDAEEALRLHASVFNNASEGIMITDKQNRVVSINNAVTEITGYTEEELLGEPPKHMASGHQSKIFYQEMWSTINKSGRWRGEIWNRKKNGDIYAERLTISAIKDEQGEVVNYLSLFADITEIKNTESMLQRMAHYDALTHLPNRTLLSERLELALIQAQRNQTLFAVCFIDLDDFKPINDLYGHDVGDKLLIEVANRLNQVVRGGDTVARMGGDEFVLLITDIHDTDELVPVLNRINEKVVENITIDTHTLSVSASVGVAIYPLDNVDADTLLRHADLSMYEAKQAGRNGYHIFDVKLDQQVHETNLQLERIESGLRNDEFRLFYQPKVNIRTHQVIGMEALIRWQHPDRGLLGTVKFLPIIDSHELIITLGDWVLEHALQQIQYWQEHGMKLQVSVNVSAKQIQHVDFVNKLEQLLERFPDVSSSLLELELLETSALETYQTAQVVQATGQQLGVSFALDDFGTGYSSLSYLRQLPVKTLKIDRSFISNIIDNEEDFAIVKGIIELADVFKRQTVAEGVETKADCETLLKMGCDTVQGYYIARPMPADEVLEWVKQYHAKHQH